MSSSTLETLSNWFNLATVVLGAFAALAALIALYFSTQLNKIKEAEFTKFKQESSERIAVADSVAAKANERAAEANRKAEEEKLARVKIEKQLAPRYLSESDADEIAKELLPFASSFDGRKVKILSNTHDAEGAVFGLIFNEILARAGIETNLMIGRYMPVGLVDIGVNVTGPTKDKKFILALTRGVFSRLKTTIVADSNDKYSETKIFIGAKPVPGLPNLKMLNRKAQQ